MNPLHLAAFNRMFPKDRCTGKSTALALNYISKAISNPYKPIVIRDHFESTGADTELARMVKHIVDKLGLEEMYITFISGVPTITFGKVK